MAAKFGAERVGKRLLWEIARYPNATHTMLTGVTGLDDDQVRRGLGWLYHHGLAIKRPVSRGVAVRLGGTPWELTGKGALELEERELGSAARDPLCTIREAVRSVLA